MEQKEFKVGFRFVGKNIQVHMHTNQVGPQEALGLLDMAKDQILSNLRKGRQEIFSSVKKNKDGKFDADIDKNKGV